MIPFEHECDDICPDCGACLDDDGFCRYCDYEEE